MDLYSANIRGIFRRYRKHIVISAFAFIALLTLSVVGIGYAVYKTAALAGDKVRAMEPAATEATAQLPDQAARFVEGFVLSLASGWLQQTAVSGEAAQVKHGLSCFDALGGPSPAAIVEYVQRTVDDAKLAAQLDELSKTLRTTATVSGPTACANWILNS